MKLDDQIRGRITDSIRLDDASDTGFIAKQVIAQREQKPIYLDRLISSEVGGQLLPGVKLISNHLGGFTGPGIWEPSDANSAQGLLHIRQRAGWRWGTKVATTNFHSADEKFIECDQGTMDAGNASNALHVNLRMERPYVQDCTYAAMWRNARNVQVDELEVRYSRRENQRRGVEINGGSEITYADYRIYGGCTGLAVTIQGSADAPRNITFLRGEVRDVSEESISVVDTRASALDGSSALLDILRVSGKENGGICCTTTHLYVDWSIDTIAVPTASPGTPYGGRDILVMKGAGKDRMIRISGAPDWSLVGKSTRRIRFATPITAEEAARFADGDIIGIVAIPQAVRVIEPRIYLGDPLKMAGRYQTGVSFWGGGYGCELINAELFGGTDRNAVRLAHVGGIAPRAAAFARKELRGQLPVFNARIDGLTLHDCDLTLGSWVYGPTLPETYRNFISNVKLRGNSQRIVMPWPGAVDKAMGFEIV